MKKIKNSDYYITKKGIVVSPKGMPLKPFDDTHGYECVHIYYNNGKRKCKKVHRLVMENLIDNPENYPCGNHIDGNKRNNNITNLEWCTYSHNNQHAYDIGLRPSKKNNELAGNMQGI